MRLKVHIHDPLSKSALSGPMVNGPLVDGNCVYTMAKKTQFRIYFCLVKKLLTSFSRYCEGIVGTALFEINRAAINLGAIQMATFTLS